MSDAAAWAVGAGVLPVAGYLVGSVPFGFLAGRLRGVDIRTRGSGNVGATNVWRVMGRRWGIGVFAADVLKGLLPVLAAGVYLKHQGVIRPPTMHAVWLMTALAAILGHVYCAWLGFKGGKGVATSLGVVLGVWPYYTLAGLVALGVWILVTWASRYVSLGSICASVAFPAALLVISQSSRGEHWALSSIWPLLAFGLLMPLLVIWRHRGNIRRLLSGTENRFGGGKQEASSGAPADRE
ncbi:MAG: Glycerol-3-phosphate acyltransferase [Phycisphaerae bacterium]|nr:Glycerol-3-phosphate acyltransferase [Phycisphaerae bacterium]